MPSSLGSRLWGKKKREKEGLPRGQQAWPFCMPSPCCQARCGADPLPGCLQRWDSPGAGTKPRCFCTTLRWASCSLCGCAPPHLAPCALAALRDGASGSLSTGSLKTLGGAAPGAQQLPGVPSVTSAADTMAAWRWGLARKLHRGDGELCAAVPLGGGHAPWHREGQPGAPLPSGPAR